MEVTEPDLRPGLRDRRYWKPRTDGDAGRARQELSPVHRARFLRPTPVSFGRAEGTAA
jgi:hypothetical protein